MKGNKLVELSMDFSIDIINLVKYLKANHETIISNQIGRNGTSIGANIHERIIFVDRMPSVTISR